MGDIINFDEEYAKRKQDLMDQLKSAYGEVYEERFDTFSYLLKNMDNAFSFRSEAYKKRDLERAQNTGWFQKNNAYGMTVYVDDKENTLSKLTEHVEYFKDFDISFLNIMPVLKPALVVSKQGALPEFISVDVNKGTISDLHNFCVACQEIGISVCFDNIGEYCQPQNIDKLFANPLLFNKLVFDVLMFANFGVDIFKINSRPYKWSDLGLDFPYTDQKIHITRLLKCVLDIVCPGCILLCDGEFDDSSVFSGFGSMLHQECHLVNNMSNRDMLKEAMQTRNVTNLRKMLDSLTMISRNTVFLNNVQDPWQKDWDNLANICGISKANDRIELEMATDYDMMLQGYLMMIPGVPFMYLGDELGQTQGKGMDWSKTKLRFNTETPQYKIYNNLMLLKRIRAVYDVFSRDARFFTYDTFDASVLGMVRTMGDNKIIALFNFSPVQKTAWIIDPGPYYDILSNDYIRDQSIYIKPYGMMWLYNHRPENLEDY
ncbi:MAG: hypothetical protein ACI4GD_08095 [Lachnospiraceae bacterium]